MDLTELTISEAAAALRRKEISAETYADALLAQAERLADLNAFIHLDPAQVRADARAVDKAPAPTGPCTPASDKSAHAITAMWEVPPGRSPARRDAPRETITLLGAGRSQKRSGGSGREQRRAAMEPFRRGRLQRRVSRGHRARGIFQA